MVSTMTLKSMIKCLKLLCISYSWCIPYEKYNYWGDHFESFQNSETEGNCPKNVASKNASRSSILAIEFFCPAQMLFQSCIVCMRTENEKEEAIFVSNVIYRSIYVHVRCALYLLSGDRVCVLNTFRHFDCKSPPVINKNL